MIAPPARIAQLLAAATLAVLAAAGCHRVTQDDQSQGAPMPGNRVWGVTISDPYNLGPTVDALRRLPRRMIARVVFDETQGPSTYLPLVPSIHGVADVMGEILDSQFVSNVTPAQYVKRTQDYIAALGNDVDIWEVGNEINGEWLGQTADVVAKLRGSYDVVKGQGRRAALTLYYNHDCWSAADHEMFTWASANIPADVKAGLDWVLVSYYEDDCNGYQPDWQAEFNRLAGMFPNAQLGIGECGTKVPGAKAAFVTRYYSMRIDNPRYVGGYFWWYFSGDMVPSSKPLWKTLDALLKSF